jgi:hypothetical protein
VSFHGRWGGAAVPDPSVIGTFECNAALNITAVHGEISERLDCLPSELQGYGWEPFIPPADFGITRQMAMDLQSGQAGFYTIRAQAKCGDPVLHLRIRTLMLRSAGQVTLVHGVLDLLHAESRRTIVLPG